MITFKNKMFNDAKFNSGVDRLTSCTKISVEKLIEVITVGKEIEKGRSIFSDAVKVIMKKYGLKQNGRGAFSVPKEMPEKTVENLEIDLIELDEQEVKISKPRIKIDKTYLNSSDLSKGVPNGILGTDVITLQDIIDDSGIIKTEKAKKED